MQGFVVARLGRIANGLRALQYEQIEDRVAMTHTEDDRFVHFVAELRERGLDAKRNGIVRVDPLRQIPEPACRVSIATGTDVEEAALFQRFEYAMTGRDGHVRQARDF